MSRASRLGLVLSGPVWRAASRWLGESERVDVGGGIRVARLRSGAVDVVACSRSSEPRYPHDVAYDAIAAFMRDSGIEHAVTTAVSGSLVGDVPVPGLVLHDDFIDQHRIPHLPYAAAGPVPVFQDFTRPYCDALNQLIEGCARELDVALRPVCYVGVDGPRYETAAEVNALRILGGDVVGMTGVRENVALRAAGIGVATVGIVSNLGAGLSAREVSSDEIRERADAVAPVVVDLLKLVVERLGRLACGPHAV